MIEFAPYRLDLRAQRLWRESELVVLRPKTWALLRYLAEHPHELVSKDDLVRAVWGGVALSDDALTRTVGELRRSLDDDARAPRVIQTVHGRGFRFIAPLATPPAAAAGLGTSNAFGRGLILSGRDRELSMLWALFRSASHGQRQIVFVSGETGAGKTSIAHTFVSSLHASRRPVRIGWGQCFEQVAAREPYMPVLDAFEQLGRAATGGRFASTLRAVAPSWLLHMPSLRDAGDAERLSAVRSGTTPHRMLRELAELVEAVSIDEPLVLVLEDLHWSDHGTIDALSLLAQRTEPARLIVVATYRSAEAAAEDHPIMQMVSTLQACDLCTVMPLRGLGRADVAEYLQRRLGNSPVAGDVASLVHEHTHGNPFMMVTLVERLLASGQIADRQQQWTMTRPAHEIAAEIPDTFRHILLGQLRLTTAAERDVLDAASVAGVELDSREVAAALGESVPHVEAECERLCQAHHLLRFMGRRDWPDGTRGARYAFVHAAYQHILYDALPPARRATLHQRIGERLEAGFGAHLERIAAQLATHFQHGTDARRAVLYLAECANASYARRACSDTVARIDQALRLLGHLPPDDDLAALELQQRQLYAVVVAETRGYSLEGLRENLTRALALTEQIGDARAAFDVLYAFYMLYVNRGELERASIVARQLLESASGPAERVRAVYVHGATALWSGDLRTAETFLRRAASTASSRREESCGSGADPVVGAAAQDSLRRWVAGASKHACSQHRRIIAAAERLEHPVTLAHALGFAAMVLVLSGRWKEAEAYASRLLALAAEHGFPRYTATALICLGRVKVEHGDVERGMAEMRQGLEMLREAALHLGQSLMLSFYADACVCVEDWQEGLRATNDGLAFCRDTGERLFEAELWRLEGTLLQMRARAHTARRHESSVDRRHATLRFKRAVTLARSQGARELERRADRHASGVSRSRGTRRPVFTMGASPQPVRTTKHPSAREKRRARRPVGRET